VFGRATDTVFAEQPVSEFHGGCEVGGCYGCERGDEEWPEHDGGSMARDRVISSVSCGHKRQIFGVDVYEDFRALGCSGDAAKAW